MLFVFIGAAGITLCHTALAQEGTADGMISRPVVEYKSGALRDPFQPAMEKKEEKVVQEVQQKQEKKIDLIQPGSDIGNLKVQGIIWGGRIPQAIINDQVFNVGDTIEGIEILNIDKNGITLSSGGALNNLPVLGGAESPAAAGPPGSMERP